MTIEPTPPTRRHTRNRQAMTPQLRNWSAVLSAALVAACGGGGDGDTSATAARDKVAPAVTYAAPSHNAQDVGTNTQLTITFSEPMDEASLAAAIRLVDDGDTPVPLRDVVFDAENNIVTITPQAPLTPDRVYRAGVSTAAKDLAGHALAQAYDWSFGTAAGADTTAPTVTSFAPADRKTNVSTRGAVAMSFSEPMDAASVDAAFALSVSGKPVAGRLAYVGQAAVFSPQAALTPYTTYVATLGRGASDLAGNGMAAAVEWSFTTGGRTDDTPPSVLDLSPPNQSTNVPRGTALSVTFSEPPYPFVYGRVAGVLIEVAIDYTTNVVSMKPTEPLGSSAYYSGTVNVKDLAGNAMPEPFNWSFTTAP